MQNIFTALSPLILIFLAVTILLLFIPLVHFIKRFDAEKKNRFKGKPCSYQKKHLFTNSEFAFIKHLEPIANEKNLLIFTKIRLSDIIDIDKNKSGDWKTASAKINSMHIDFVLCDKKSLTPKYFIELDGPSHNNPDQKEKDKFKDTVMEQCGLKITRFTTGQNFDFSIL